MTRREAAREVMEELAVRYFDRSKFHQDWLGVDTERIYELRDEMRELVTTILDQIEGKP